MVDSKSSPRLLKNQNASPSPKSPRRSFASSSIKSSPNRLTRSQTKSSPRYKFDALPMEKHSLKSRRNLFDTNGQSQSSEKHNEPNSPSKHANNKNSLDLFLGKRGRPPSKSTKKWSSSPTKSENTESSPSKRQSMNFDEDFQSEPMETDTPTKRRSSRFSKSPISPAKLPKSTTTSPSNKNFIDFGDEKPSKKFD